MQLLFLRQWFSDDILQATGWTLIHSLWQGLLAAAVAAIVIISTRKTAASVRYNLLGIVMVLFLVTTFITFGKQLNIAAITGSTDPSSPVVAAGEVFFTTDVPVAATAVSTGFMDTFINWFNIHADLFVLGWTLFFFLNCLKLFTGMASVHRLRQYRTHPVTEEWKDKAEQLSQLLGIRRRVALLQSELVKVPIALGVLKPVILLPVGLITHLPPAQVETILLHELAHIRRSDYLVNLIQRFAEAIFFFNPAFLWISSLMRQEREACCDDVVIAHTDQKRQYLDALVAFQEYSLKRSYAMAFTSRRDYLLARVKRMLTRENKRLGLFEKLALFGGLVLFSAFTYLSKEGSIIDTADRIEWNGTPVDYTLVPKESPARQQAAAMPVTPVTYPRVPQDTVPPKSAVIRKMLEGYKFKKLESSTTNINGDEKMVIVVTGPDNKKYTVQRNNGKYVGLSIDDKPVDAKELSDWTPLFEKVADRLGDNAKSQENKYNEQLAMTDKITEAAKQQSIYQAQMNELSEKQMEAKIRHQQRVADLRKEYQRKRVDSDKMMKGLNDSITMWGKELQQEMKELANDMERLIKDTNKKIRKEDKPGEKPRNENRIEKPRSGGNSNGSGNGNGNGNGNSSSNGKDDNGISNVQKTEKNITAINARGEKLELKSVSVFDSQNGQTRERVSNTKEIKIEEKSEKKQEGKEDNIKIKGDDRRGRKDNGKTKTATQNNVFKHNENKWNLNNAAIQKVNFDFENSIKLQLYENANLQYTPDINASVQYDASGKVQYDPSGIMRYKPMAVAPVLSQKPDPKKDKKLNNKPRTLLFDKSRRGSTGWTIENPRTT